MDIHFLLLLILLLAAVVLSIRTGKLTTAGALTGGLMGLFIYSGAGFAGLAMTGTFFLLGVWATGWKREEKQKLHQDESQKRTAGQVLANAGVAAVCGLCAFSIPQQAPLFRLMMAASLAAATADTVSSELGSVYGSRFYNVLTGKKDQRGLDGVISAEGTVLGICGSAVIAAVFAAGFGWSTGHFLLIVVSGTIGNLVDSFLGASLERSRIMGNNLVNFLNTLAAAVTAFVVWRLW